MPQKNMLEFYLSRCGTGWRTAQMCWAAVGHTHACALPHSGLACAICASENMAHHKLRC